MAARHIPTLTVQFGEATLLGPRRARVTRHEGKPEEIAFAHAIIATGSVPRPLQVTGIELPQVMTSEQLLDIKQPPKRLVVIGAGPIGVEMAQIFAAFGSHVTMIEAGLRILAPVDDEISATLQNHFREQGIGLELGARVLRSSAKANASAYSIWMPVARSTR